MISKFFFHGTPPTLSIIPNPASEEFTIVSDKSLGHAHVLLYNASGNAVLETSINVVKDQGNTFSISNAIEGYYRIVVLTPFGSWSQSLIVQK
jgi:hypothetical protein